LAARRAGGSIAGMFHCAWPCLVLAPLLAQEPAARTAQQILRDFDRVGMPSMSSGGDAASVQRFKDEIAAGCRRKAEFALELWRTQPDHARAAEVLDIRWAGMTNALGEAEKVAAETKRFLADPGLRADVRQKAAYAQAHALNGSPEATNLQRLRAARLLLEAAPEDERTGLCLVEFAERHLGDPEVMRPLLEIAAERWPESPHAGRPAGRMLALLDSIGRPFAEQLPEAQRTWFAEATAQPVAATVVQVWNGAIRTAGKDRELEALVALHGELGEGGRLLGLLHGDLAAKLPAAQQAGVAWPQAAIEAPAAMAQPFRSHRLPLYFVLDRQLAVVAVTWNAASLAERVRELRGE